MGYRTTATSARSNIMSQQGEENNETSERTSDDVDTCDSGPKSNTYLNPLYGLHPNSNPSSGLAIRPNINQPNWRFTSNPAVAGGPVLHINGPGRISPRNLRPCRGEIVDGVVIRQPGNAGGGRAPEILRNLNSSEVGRRGSESEDERTSRSVSRRSSGGDSGVANLSEGELIDTDNQDTGHQGQARRRKEGRKDDENLSYSSVPMAGLPLVGAMFGLCLGGPVGLLAGAKLGGVAAVGGSILGYTGASVIKDQRELRGYIDDHYKKEPDLYVLSPKEEAVLNRRRMSDRTPPETTRHLPSLHRSGSLYRRGPAGYRRPSAAGSCSSAGSSPAARRRAESFRHAKSLRKKPSTKRSTAESAKPPHLVASGQYRRLGDLSEEEQRSVLALICSQGPLEDRTFAVSSHICDVHPDCEQQVLIAQGATALPSFKSNFSSWNSRTAEEKRRTLNVRMKARTSSLPDVLEEDSISVKSF